VTDNENIFGIPKPIGKPKRGGRKVKDNRFPPGTRVRYTNDWYELQERLGRLFPHYEGRRGVVTERSLNLKHLRITWDDAIEPTEVCIDFLARA
jgi:hypothetical protein